MDNKRWWKGSKKNEDYWKQSKMVRLRPEIYEDLKKCAEGFEKPAATIHKLIKFYLKRYGI